MDRLVTVREMRERYGCTNPTARKYLRQVIPHMENPLTAPEWAVLKWEESRIPVEITRRKQAETRNGVAYVPRTR